MIDAHVHLWSLARPEVRWPTAVEGVLHRDFEIAALRAALDGHHAVLVQSQEDARDTQWLLQQAQDPAIAAVVGWVDLEAGDAVAQVAELARARKLVGLRPMAQHREAEWLADETLSPGLAAMTEHGLRLDALVRVNHLGALRMVAKRYPQLAIVIDHAAKPAIGTPDAFAGWYEAIASLAEHAQVHCKLSGLCTELGGAPVEAITRYIEALLALFGSERLIWGSDWPVIEATWGRTKWFALAQQLVPAEAHEAVFGGNAARFYGLASEALQ